MKKLILVLLSVFLFQCSNDNNSVSADDDIQAVETFLFELIVDQEYYNEFTEAFLVLTDFDGNIIVQGALENGQLTSLEAFYDESDGYHAHIFSKETFSNGYQIYEVRSMLNMTPSSFNLKRRITNDVIGDFALDITNTGVILDVYASGTGGGGGTTNNGGEYNWTGDLYANPEDHYIAFLKDGEVLPRYFWQENIAPDSQFTFQYSDLPQTNNIQIDFPSNEDLTIKVDGIELVGNPIKRHKVYSAFLLAPTSISFYAPQNTFDNYIFNYEITNGNFTHNVFEVTSQFPNSVELIQGLDLNVNSTSIDNLDFSVDGVFDMTQTKFKLIEGSDYVINTTIYNGESNITAFNYLNFLNASPFTIDGVDYSNFELQDTRVIRNNNTISFEQYLIPFLDNSIQPLTEGYLDERIIYSEN